ncbi:hypothetical protein F0562_005852 [Nyssa sinensis]|uniref:Uncharacterized protein n=1 Tax=Nyssa sinensis TaxID=561372 RepID=A0A5J5AJG0_9ASTE|nr:hypothetical protein F0562_005852 [Nyssa sinensis]
MDATEAASRIENLQKDLEVSNTELAKANSVTEGEERARKLPFEVEIARQSLAETKRKATVEVELIRIEARRDQDAAAKMGCKLMGMVNNICVRKLLKLLFDFILENLDQVDLTPQELEEDEEDEDEEDIPPTS